MPSHFSSQIYVFKNFLFLYIICLYAKFSRTNELMYYVTTVAKSPCNTVLITVLPGALFLFRSNYFYKLYITFFLSFYILSNVRKALFYRLYGHFYFLFTFAYRGISSYVFPLKRGKFRGKYFYAIRRFISVLALSIEECAYQSIVILILE